MRYATVAKNGRILGVFVSDPELLALREIPEGAEVIECPDANAATSYWNGSKFVNRMSSTITLRVDGNTVTVDGLPDSSVVSITSAATYRVFEASQQFSISLQESGSHVIQVDPWPYLKKTFCVSI
jgi:hypothetical protein